MNPPRLLSRLSMPALVAACAVVSGAWRLWLGTVYAGWEESDYGNLAMIQGVVAGHFLHYDMNHMPGYYGLAALVHVVVDDAVVAGRSVSWIGGVAALVAAMWLAARGGGRPAVLLTASALVAQPEFSLYAASSLREPVYAAGLMGFLVAWVYHRPWLAGLAGCLAFSVRFDAMLILPMVVALDSIGRRAPGKDALRALLPVFVAALLWSVYCRVEHGTFQFWAHSVAVNLETGLGEEATGPVEWGLAGAGVALRLLARLLPWRLGWGVWLAVWLTALLLDWRKPGLERSMLLLTAVSTAFWLSLGFVGQHAPEHNLYWKWMFPLVPLWGAVAGVGGARLVRLVAERGTWGRLAATGGVVLALGQAWVAHAQETERQVVRSHDLYAPQVAIARWVEAEIPDDRVLLVDNIPACWINRRAHRRTLESWFDVPVADGDADGLATWLEQKDVPWVLWFAEDWTRAPEIAPQLRRGGSVPIGRLQLVERSREDEYGWILYEVVGEGIHPVDGLVPPPTFESNLPTQEGGDR